MIDTKILDQFVAALSRVLFRRYFFPFEATSVLLIIAAVAVMVLASRQRRAITRAEQAAEERSARTPRTGLAS